MGINHVKSLSMTSQVLEQDVIVAILLAVNVTRERKFTHLQRIHTMGFFIAERNVMHAKQANLRAAPETRLVPAMAVPSCLVQEEVA